MLPDSSTSNLTCTFLVSTKSTPSQQVQITVPVTFSVLLELSSVGGTNETVSSLNRHLEDGMKRLLVSECGATDPDVSLRMSDNPVGVQTLASARHFGRQLSATLLPADDISQEADPDSRLISYFHEFATFPGTLPTWLVPDHLCDTAITQARVETFHNAVAELVKQWASPFLVNHGHDPRSVISTASSSLKTALSKATSTFLDVQPQVRPKELRTLFDVLRAVTNDRRAGEVAVLVSAYRKAAGISEPSPLLGAEPRQPHLVSFRSALLDFVHNTLSEIPRSGTQDNPVVEQIDRLLIAPATPDLSLY